MRWLLMFDGSLGGFGQVRKYFGRHWAWIPAGVSRASGIVSDRTVCLKIKPSVAIVSPDPRLALDEDEPIRVQRPSSVRTLRGRNRYRCPSPAFGSQPIVMAMGPSEAHRGFRNPDAPGAIRGTVRARRSNEHWTKRWWR